MTVDAASKKMIIKFATVSSTEPTLSWTFGGKAITLAGGQYSMSKVVKDGQYFYTFEISEVCALLITATHTGSNRNNNSCCISSWRFGGSALLSQFCSTSIAVSTGMGDRSPVRVVFNQSSRLTQSGHSSGVGIICTRRKQTQYAMQ